MEENLNKNNKFLRFLWIFLDFDPFGVKFPERLKIMNLVKKKFLQNSNFKVSFYLYVFRLVYKHIDCSPKSIKMVLFVQNRRFTGVYFQKGLDPQKPKFWKFIKK